MIDLLATTLIGAGLAFFAAGSLGLLRLPDLYSRLHALTKADNVGLGLLVAGLAILAGDPLTVDGVDTEHIAALIDKMQQAGVEFSFPREDQ